MNLKLQCFFVFGILFLFTSCTDKGAAIEQEAKLKVEQKLKSAENIIKVLGRSSSGVNLNNENFDSLSRNVIRALSESTYEARKAYLICEVYLEKWKKELDANSNGSDNADSEKYLQDSVYHSIVKRTILQIDSTALNRTSDPTIQELLIEIEQMHLLKQELEALCE